ncbi:MAG TPA: GntR family transcriptional regulator [Bosea sp. (in: a-proteobacteria)]|jgi:DNA-binding GntR family transcriptional regulator|uniref:GntR family transcriptional regulator n=1 Tax=Bosea sp. (in: a-proteobacteria) TaxID=1871050 RepID=UPI002E15BAEF|nr:GntR family transcriptional regulator [Bosea sp. (in: a-proteobacteria)]
MIAPLPTRAKQPQFRQTMTGAAVAELRRRILSGSVAAGEALRQDALAKEFGISRIPIREAFHQLAAEGLVTLHPHRGAVVTALSAADIAELFDLRAMLEPDLIRRAVPRLQPSDFARAEIILAEYDAAIREGDLDAYGELNTEYHLSLYQVAGRQQTLELVRVLLANTDRYTRVQLTMSDGATTRAKREHAALLDLCRMGDAEGAARLTLDHVLAVRHDLLELLQDADDAEAQPSGIADGLPAA